MNEQELKEQTVMEIRLDDGNPFVSFEQTADSILSLMREAVEGIENPYDKKSKRHFEVGEFVGFNGALEAVKKLLGDLPDKVKEK
jgi:hypothetical protein